MIKGIIGHIKLITFHFKHRKNLLKSL